MAIGRTWYTWRQRDNLEPVISGPEIIWKDKQQACEMVDWFWKWVANSDEQKATKEESVLCRVEEHVEVLEYD